MLCSFPGLRNLSIKKCPNITMNGLASVVSFLELKNLHLTTLAVVSFIGFLWTSYTRYVTTT